MDSAPTVSPEGVEPSKPSISDWCVCQFHHGDSIGDDGGSRTRNPPFLRRSPLPFGVRRRKKRSGRSGENRTLDVLVPETSALPLGDTPIFSTARRDRTCLLLLVTEAQSLDCQRRKHSVDHLRIERSADSLSESPG